MATRQIDGARFDVQPINGERSFVLSPQLAPVVADFLALYAMFAEGFVEILSSGGEDLNKELTTKDAVRIAQPLLMKAAPVIANISRTLSPEKLKELSRELLAGAQMNGQLLFTPNGNPIDILLQGKTVTYWKLLVFALETSYPDFFALGAVFGASSPAEDDSSETSTT